MDALSRVVVVGAGLIGSSIALALRERGIEVDLADRDPASLRLAEELGAGTRWYDGKHPSEPADLCVLAVPADAVPATLREAQRARLARAYTDVGSVKCRPLAEARKVGCELSTFVGGHPLAGRERTGPSAARADLFLGRPWVLCPAPETGRHPTDTAAALARACAGEPVRLDPQEHDHAVALVSHVPHAVASAAAARLRDAEGDELGLAGAGLRDTTRVAAGDPDLWAGILRANAGPVAEVLAALVGDLQALVEALRTAEGGGEEESAEGGKDADPVADLLRRGADGRARVPGKRGGPAPSYAAVPVVIRDRPGELGRLFAAAGEAGVNVEDVVLEHSPGLPVGVAELSVRPERARVLTARLRAAGWSVHG